MNLSLLLLVFSLIFTVVSRLLLYSTIDKTSRLDMKSFSTVRDTQRGSQLHGEEKREEGDRGDQEEKLCLTLCDPIDGSPPGSSIPGILQARTLE